MLKTIKPTNNSQRNTTLLNYQKKLTSVEKKASRKLFGVIKPCSSRNNHGRFTMRHQGGHHKRFYRIIDFKSYEKDGIVGKVLSIEYDPNRNCFISLISYRDGSFSYIITPEGLKVGDQIISGENEEMPIKVGNNLPLRYIPTHTSIHNLELKPQK